MSFSTIVGKQPFTCTWIAFQEPESEIDYYLFGISKLKGDDSTMKFVKVPYNKQRYLVSGEF